MVTSDFFLFADHKRLLARKNFSDNETLVIFEIKDQTYHRNSMEIRKLL